MKTVAPALMSLALLTVLFASVVTTQGSELISNGGFESGSSGWSWLDGELTTVASPVHGGSASGRFASDAQPSNQVVYQSMIVAPGQPYTFSGWVWANDPQVFEVNLSVNWFNSFGPVNGTRFSTSNLEGSVPNFRFLTTSEFEPPSAATSARVNIQVIATGEFEIYLDDFSFEGPTPPPPPPTPTSTAVPSTPASTPVTTPSPPPTASPPPAPSTKTPASSATPTPTPAPSPNPNLPTPSPANNTPNPTSIPPQNPPPAPTPTVTRSPNDPPLVVPTASASTTPTKTPLPDPTTTPAVEPLVFGQLANGGFEQARADGTPYAWRKFGGSYRSTDSRSHSGNSSLEVSSSTESTKWVYQTLMVTGGEYYQSQAYALNDDSNVAGLFLRVSFYNTEDGSGRALSSVDSTETLSVSHPDFRQLSTGIFQAPPDAKTAKLRLMLRPAPESSGIAFFDSVSFQRTTQTPEAIQPTQGQDQPPATPGISPQFETQETPDRRVITVETSLDNPSPTVLGNEYQASLDVKSTPASFANVRGPTGPADLGALSAEGSDHDWLIAVAIVLPAAGLVLVGIAEARRSRRRQD